ncbi:unnamed protein product [Colias eurytheme]|nr:unnamed protein product [Colias eurytheme]
MLTIGVGRNFRHRPRPKPESCGAPTCLYTTHSHVTSGTHITSTCPAAARRGRWLALGSRLAARHRR